ncbi:MAG: TetR/AcrR family transcriptional regulator [Phycisphaerae bacterium]|nr:TetR/AcrR family transcriptional regulator [Phycisphaerae bacterium]
MAANKHIADLDVQNVLVRDRLLDAAEKLFCEKGFDRTSVRDLTQEAKCNIAAVNYHFGGKNKLYIQMFHRQMRRMMHRYREAVGQILEMPDASLEDLLRAVVSQPLHHVESNDPSGMVMKLLVREVLNRQVAREEVFGEVEDEFFALFAEAFRRFCPNLSLRRAQLLFFSLDALVVHPMLFYDFYQDVVPALSVEDVIEHIVVFAAAGIRAHAQGAGQ